MTELRFNKDVQLKRYQTRYELCIMLQIHTEKSLNEQKIH